MTELALLSRHPLWLLPSPVPRAGETLIVGERQDGGPMSDLEQRLGQSAGSGAEDAEIVARLRAHDEQAFAELVDRYQTSMLRIAQLYVRDRAAAEEVVQETWLGVLRGIDRFEERSSLKTWIFRILSNRAKTRGQREGRSIPFSALAASEAATSEPAVDPDRFLGPEHGRAAGAWASPPRSWPHEEAVQRETLEILKAAIQALPEAQREVIRLRDVEGLSAEYVARALEISDGNQRVLLHRARAKVRAALEAYLNPEIVGEKR